MASPKPRRVLIGVDDTAVSAYAFTWALEHLVREGDHVVVLTAAPYVGVDYPNAEMTTEYGVQLLNSPLDSEAVEKEVTGYSKSLANKYLKICLQKNISCEGEVVKGDAGSWIVDEGERLAADVIVVGSNARGLLQRTLLGSISDYVLHNAPCTVAIVRQPGETLLDHYPLPSADKRKIVIAVDESAEAVFAFTWALQNFCKPSDKVILYHVHHPYVMPITGAGTGEFGFDEAYVPPGSNAIDEVESLKESQKVVERFMEYADQETEIKCEGMVVTGQTQAKVIEGLISLKADAVIVGTHDRGVVARTFLGSVSDHLAHNSPCPLIVAKAKKESTSEPQASSEASAAKPHAT